MKVLLKIGSLNLPKDRWIDALSVFDKICVFCFVQEQEVKHERFEYIKFNEKKFINKNILRIILRTHKISSLNAITNIFIYFLRLANFKLLHYIESLHFDAIHSSYNDFDESNLLTLLLRVNQPITRAQKETRAYYNHLEKRCFEKSERIILNSSENVLFFQEKYHNIFLEKKIIIDRDEDVKSEETIRNIKLLPKYSDADKKIHAVILTAKVYSDASNIRGGGRVYYIPLIKTLIQAKIIVHLHTKTVVTTKDGYNPYVEIEKTDQFYIEKPLDFENNPDESYSILSRYDIGILHAFIPDTDVIKFDKVNIPGRYYEYQLAHVVPIIKKGQNSVVEPYFLSHNNGIVYDDLNEISLMLIKKKVFINNSFKMYIQTLYS
jgi:hypothetical protein